MIKFDFYIILFNARRICKREYQSKPNWALVCQLFGVGSTSAYEVCRQAGINPNAFIVSRVMPK